MLTASFRSITVEKMVLLTLYLINKLSLSMINECISIVEFQPAWYRVSPLNPLPLFTPSLQRLYHYYPEHTEPISSAASIMLSSVSHN